MPLSAKILGKGGKGMVHISDAWMRGAALGAANPRALAVTRERR